MSHEVSGAGYWRDRWDEGTTGWDLGGPCPVFVDLLDSERAPPIGRVAFPGCGSGHDLYHWRGRGYDATGFDFAYDGEHIEQVDIFELGTRYPEHFDTVVDYTCYCAIDPARRGEYVDVLRDTIKPGGQLVALLFPVGEREGGPPFAIDEGEIESVLGRVFDVESVETPTTSVEPRMGMERLVLMRRR